MTTLIHRKEVREAQRSPEQNKAPIRKRAEFDTLLNTLSKKEENKALSPEVKQKKINQAISDASKKYNLDPNLIRAVIKQESGFDPCAQSHCGAQGLMQLMPRTARDMGVKESFDIEQNIDGGSKYLRQMLDQFDGKLDHAIAAYNAGPTAVEKYNGVPPFAETKNYVPSVLAHMEDFSNVDSVNRTPLGQVTGMDRRVEMEHELMAFATTSNAVMSATIASTPLPKRESPKVDEAPPPNGVRV